MTNEELELYADQYCIDKFGAKTGNKYVRDALIDGYNLALRIHGVVEQSEQLVCPCCGSDKTYKTYAVHCNRCAVTTEI